MKNHALHFASLIAATMAMSPAQAEDAINDDTRSTVMRVMSPLMQGYFGATICDFEIDYDVGALYLQTQLGSDFRATPRDISFLIFMDHAQQSLVATIGVIPHNQMEKVKYCKQVWMSFGKDGQTIPALLKK